MSRPKFARRSAVVDGAEVAKNTANYLLSHNLHKSSD
jgi:hypothetical protein